MDKKNARAMGLAGFSLLITLYRMGAPFLEETKKLRKQATELEASVRTVQQEASVYGKGWEDNITKQEEKILKRLPEQLPPSDVMDYFITKFEASHEGEIRFSGVDYQKPNISDVKAASGPKARTVRHKLRGEISQEALISYIEHIEKFPSLVQILSMSFNLVQNRARNLDFEMMLDFWLLPNEWITPGKATHEKEDSPETDEKMAAKRWNKIFGTSEPPREVAGGSAGQKATNTSVGTPIPKIDAIIGESIIVDENIFEEGDNVKGWKLKRVDPQRRQVTLILGSVTKELKIP